MRFVTAFLLLAVPTIAAAQQPPAPPPQTVKPPVHQPTPAKPVVVKPVVVKPVVVPPTMGKPNPKPSTPPHKQPAHKAPAKPVPKLAPPKPVAPVPPPTKAPEPAPDLHKGSKTGLPLPRFAALKTDDVNFRRGPGARYPIEWVYKRRDLPVEIEREFEDWRLITDPDGSKGWVQAATLTGRRTAIVTGAERTLRQAPSDTSGPVAKLAAGVLLRVRSCEAQSEWCQVQINDYRGYIKRSEVWGIAATEVIQ